MSAARPGLLGKAPCQADFIRLNASSEGASHFHRWLEEGMALVLQAGARLPAVPTCFVFTTPGGRSALVGSLVASEDRVGRRFPLAVFAEVEARTLASRFPWVALAYQPLLAAAGEFLAEAGSLDWPRLQARLGALPVPDERWLAEAERLHQRALAESRGSVLWEAIGQEPEALPCYAVRTFLAACAGAREREPLRAHAILDCPLPPGGEPGPWLELACRLLRWREHPPSFFWSQGSRLLLCLGPALPSLLPFLADPARSGERLWPLRTSAPDALAAAWLATPPAHREALSRSSVSLESLLHALAR